jgi:ribose 5-phosphate isomerase B
VVRAVTGTVEQGAVKIAIANDHAGYQLKLAVTEHVRSLGHEVVDLGTDSEEPVDYPLFCAPCAQEVATGNVDLGIVIGGSGQGEQIAANKVHGARAALCQDEYTARLARRHNNANVLSLGARIVASTLALEGGRHQARIDQLSHIEAEECARRKR